MPTNKKKDTVGMDTHHLANSIKDASVRVSIVMKRHHDHGNSYKKNCLIGVGLQFRGFVHFFNSGKHDYM